MAGMKNIDAEWQVKTVLFYASHRDQAYVFRSLAQFSEISAGSVSPSCFHKIPPNVKDC
jgi:hypothetical protein